MSLIRGQAVCKRIRNEMVTEKETPRSRTLPRAHAHRSSDTQRQQRQDSVAGKGETLFAV